MIRIDVVIGNATEQADRVIEALHQQLKERLSGFAPVIHIKTGAVSSLSVSGARDGTERETVMIMIQQVWEDDSWIPEEVKL